MSEAKYKAQAESREAVATAVATSKLFSNQGYMIDIGSTPKYSKINCTYNTDKPQSYQTPNELENSSQNLKKQNHFSRSNLDTQVGNDEIEDSDKINLHRLSISIGNAVNISFISSSSGYFLMSNHMKLQVIQ